MEGPASLNSKIHNTIYNGAHFVRPISSLRVNEFDLVRGLLQILQGNSSPLFIWDNAGQRYNVKVGICIAHLSLSSLYNILNQFLYAASCLRLVGEIVSKTEISVKSPPTLRAFSSSVSVWLKRLRNIALKEEVKIIDSSSRTVPTLLGFANTLSSLCSGAEYLWQIVNEAIPHAYHDSVSSIPAVEVAVHILDHLYKKLHDVCLVQDGEEEAYRMLVYLFVGSSLPYTETLDSWLYEGILDDPFNELFFYENKAVSIDDAEFWEKRYLLRSLRQQKSDAELCSITDWRSQTDLQACPLFIKEMAKLIVSAGKSLQLIRHFPLIPDSSTAFSGNYNEIDDSGSLYGAADFGKALRGHITAGLTLSEVFCVSLAGLIGHGDHVFSKLQQEDFHSLIIHSVGSETKNGEGRQMSGSVGSSRRVWLEFLADALHGKKCALKAEGIVSHREESEGTGLERELQIAKSFCPENPVITVSQLLLPQKRNAWMDLNSPINIQLPPLNDDNLRESVFNSESGIKLSARGTDYAFGFQFNESEYKRSQEDRRVLNAIFPFPTILPSSQEDQFMSELLPFQKNSTLSSKFLNWIKDAEPKATPLPAVIFDECLLFYIKRQVDYIGSHILSKLLREWRLMDELAVLRAIYLLGSGDLLQHFLTIIFNKLDKGESWDDDFELNMILQESITNSADRMLLSAPDSLIVSLAKPHDVDIRDQNNSNNVSTPCRSHDHNSGINGLDTLNFSYKVSWPLELIANSEAIKKYNQVMRFLLKVKRAKFVLDKARKWIWKGRSSVTVYAKHHWLVEQKLLHFVDAFHQYVMDRVYCSAWRELCKGMAAARSLDEVMQVHETYLLSIQRQCFVVPDKLWALIASRINTILGLALDFYSIQQTLYSGGAVSAIKARCVMEVERIEKLFDECITFLLRVLSFKLNVGHFPHLADLVTRINYNYYYMSDSGNMITAPRSEAVKLQKAFSRTTS